MMILSFTEKQKEMKILSPSNYFFIHLEDRIPPHMFVSTQHVTLAGEKLVQFSRNMLVKTNIFACTNFTCDLLLRRYVMCRSSQNCFRIMTTILYAFLTAPMHATFHVHYILHVCLH